MAKLKITQSRSVIGNSGKQRRTLQTLGLRGMHQTVTREDTPVVRGMIDKVRHLVTVEEMSA